MIEDFRLKVFMLVIQTGSFTIAANSLGISQPAVSQNINTLEKSLGVKLFYRNRGEVSLTAAGSIFKDYAEKIIYWYDAAERMFGELGKVTVNKPIIICADNVVAGYVMSGALSGIFSVRKDISIRIISSESPCETPEYDVLISVAPSPKTIDFEGESKLVGVMDAVVVSSPLNKSLVDAAIKEDGTEVSVKPFSTLAGVHISNSFAVWDRYYGFLTPDLVPRVSMVSSSIEAIKSFVEASDNVVAVLPSLSVTKEKEAGRLLQMPVILPEFTFDIHFNPSPMFSGKEICHLIKNILKDKLK